MKPGGEPPESQSKPGLKMVVPPEPCFKNFSKADIFIRSRPRLSMARAFSLTNHLPESVSVLSKWLCRSDPECIFFPGSQAHIRSESRPRLREAEDSPGTARFWRPYQLGWMSCRFYLILRSRGKQNCGGPKTTLMLNQIPSNVSKYALHDQ